MRRGRIEFYTAARSALNVTKDTFDAAVKQLDDLEKQLLSNFTGTTSEKTATLHCELRPASRFRDDLAPMPDSTGDERRWLFGFSKHPGSFAAKVRTCRSKKLPWGLWQSVQDIAPCTSL